MYKRLVGALLASACAWSSVAVAQESAQTAGGDVTADEATPLPPVTVQSAKEPIRKQARVRRAPQPSTVAADEPGTGAAATGGTGSGGGGVPAEEGDGTSPVGIFTLGQLDLIGGSTITNEAMWTFNKMSLDQAANLLPGVSSHNSGGSRAERDIYVRGFDRFRVPLSIDGVRIYLPADNRLDLNRFLTADLAEVQVQKGYVSVLNGPGGMGGAINLVSRKPTKEVEIEGRSGLVFNGDLDGTNAWSSYAFAGTRQRGYYAQVSGTIVDQDHFSMSDDFYSNPPAPRPGFNDSFFPYEQGGNRDRSFFKDWRINAKAGITPNATDEYSVNYTVQQGQKSAPLHVDRQVVQSYFGITNPVTDVTSQFRRFWDWPVWDTSTLSWLSKTQLGEASYMKTNVYYNTFDNTTRFYADQNYDVIRQDSIYKDHATGGFVEFGTDLIPMNTLKGAIHYRQDVHNEMGPVYQFNFYAPEQTRSEQTWSFAVENTFHATSRLDIVTGVSYDINEVLRVDVDPGDPAAELPKIDAWNGQAAAIYSYSDTGKAHVSISDRTRFPTLFERYSTRFGATDPDPNVKPERAINYELGFSDIWFRDVKVSSAVFYADIQDSIQSAFAGPNGNASIIGFNADGENYGFEASVDWDVMPGVRIGGNYTYLERDLDYYAASLTVPLPANPVNAADAVAAAQVENTPRHKAFLYASWQPFRQLTLTPSLELASDRTVLVTSCRSTLLVVGVTGQNNDGCVGNVANNAARRPNYVKLGSYALVNFQAEYAFDTTTSAAFGVTNLLDENYSLAEGFPEAGRQFFVNVRAKF